MKSLFKRDLIEYRHWILGESGLREVSKKDFQQFIKFLALTNRVKFVEVENGFQWVMRGKEQIVVAQKLEVSENEN